MTTRSTKQRRASPPKPPRTRQKWIEWSCPSCATVLVSWQRPADTNCIDCARWVEHGIRDVTEIDLGNAANMAQMGAEVIDLLDRLRASVTEAERAEARQSLETAIEIARELGIATEVIAFVSTALIGHPHVNNLIALDRLGLLEAERGGDHHVS